MTLREINEDVFESYVSKSSTNNFFQSVEMYRRLKANGVECYLLGLYYNEELSGATLLSVSNKFLFKKVFTAYKGFIVDYESDFFVEGFTDLAMEFIKKHNGIELIIEPYIVMQSRDCDGEVTKDVDNSRIYSSLLKLGFKETTSYQVKWTYCLDTDKSVDELYKDLKPNTRNTINKSVKKYSLEIKDLSYDELDVFKKITENTSNRRGFSDRTLKYYQDMYKYFGDKVKFKICVLNIPKYLDNLNTERDSITNKLSNLKDCDYTLKQRKNLETELSNCNKRINDATEEMAKYGEELVLSGAMFMLYGSEIIYLFSGSYEEHIKYNGQYLLQWDIIQYAANNGFKRYNFFGISGNFDSSSKDYGVYSFKKGFGGYVEELIGTFSLTNCKLYDLLKYVKKLIRR